MTFGNKILDRARSCQEFGKGEEESVLSKNDQEKGNMSRRRESVAVDWFPFGKNILQYVVNISPTHIYIYKYIQESHLDV